MIAESAVIGRRCGSVGVAMSMMTTCTCPLTSSRMHMYLSLSMVSDAKLMNCGLIPTLVSWTSCEGESREERDRGTARRSGPWMEAGKGAERLQLLSCCSSKEGAASEPLGT